MTKKVCLVTFILNKEEDSIHQQYFKQSQENYAKKYDYDYKIIRTYLLDEKSDKTLLTLNKICICNEQWADQYDYLICVNNNIIININAPQIFSKINIGNKIGCVSQNQPTQIARESVQRYNGYEITAKEYYKLKSNHHLDTDFVINTGVLVIQPKIHKEFLNNIFEKYKTLQTTSVHGDHFTQSVIGYELQTNEKYTLIPMKWNALWTTNKNFFNTILKLNLSIEEFIDDNYFINFSGNQDFKNIN